MDNDQAQEASYGSDYHYIPATSVHSGEGIEVTSDLYCFTVQIVNVVFVGHSNSSEFVLVDAGMPGSADEIIAAAEKRFGPNSRPKAIILTHAHFDHVGALVDLVKRWNVPVYAHDMEIPFLTGEKSYPKPDPSVEGGMVAKMSFIFPNEPIQLGDRVKALPSDGSIPGMAEFRWIHTPGHSPGHISLFRDKDRALVAGDAFTTVRQDSLVKVVTQKVEITGPPRYYTPDWEAARASVRELESLKPSVAITGHGVPVSGEELSEGLKRLADDFDALAIPDYGIYVNSIKH